MKGDAYEKKLHVIMDDLGHVKTSILLCIQVANVGVIRNMEKQLVADAVKIERIDLRLREALDDYDGLRIAHLLKGRRPSSEFNASGDTDQCVDLQIQMMATCH